jgi:hypothetical protein
MNDDYENDDSLDVDDESSELESLFAATEPANRPPPRGSQRQSQWRTVEEYMEARRLQEELRDDFDNDDEE